MNPGIYHDMPFDEYKAINAWNPSAVLPGRTSMLEVDYRRTHPKEVTPAMRFGAAVHCAVLEPDKFPLHYVLWPGPTRKAAGYKAFCEANEGREVLTVTEYDTCLAARDSAQAHPVASKLLCGSGDMEVSMVWVDRHTGLLCKSRADLILPGLMVDLKTTKSKVADDYAIKRTASTFGYHISMAARQDGYSTLTGETLDCKLIFVEQSPPHDTRALSIPDTVMIQGCDVWQNLLGQINACEISGLWPGCDSGEGELKVWNDGSEWEV